MVVSKNDDADEFKKQIESLIAEKGNIPSEVASAIEKSLLQVELENVSVMESLGFSPEMIDKIYEHGYYIFQSGKYKEALPVFNLLRELDGGEAHFTFAIAACHHHLKNYEEAIGNYMLYELLDDTNPLPYYHMYDCFTKMGQPLLAAGALQQAGRLAKQDPQYAELKVRTDLELEHLKSLKKGSQKKQESSAA